MCDVTKGCSADDYTVRGDSGEDKPYCTGCGEELEL